MVNSCSAIGCSNRHVKGGTKAFHKFPLKNKELCKRWVVALKRENFTPTSYSCICSDHFTPNDYNYCLPDKNFAGVNHKPTLKHDAVPSRFVFTVEKKARKSPFERTPIKRKNQSLLPSSTIAKKIKSANIPPTNSIKWIRRYN